MSQEPYKLLTLVIPTYNMEKYLTKCLESVTAPCIPPTLEVIVVNDGSKDRSLDIMKAFQQKRPDIIRIIDKENGHYGSCINAGLQMAKGKYFRPLDADDWMDTEVLSKLLNVLKNCDTDLFITLRTEYKIDKNNRHIVTHFPFRNVEYNKIYDISSFNISEHTYGDEFNMHSMTYKTRNPKTGKSTPYRRYMLYRLPVLFSADRPHQGLHYIRFISLLLFHRKRRTIYQCAVYKGELIAHL